MIQISQLPTLALQLHSIILTLQFLRTNVTQTSTKLITTANHRYKIVTYISSLYKILDF